MKKSRIATNDHQLLPISEHAMQRIIQKFLPQSTMGRKVKTEKIWSGRDSCRENRRIRQRLTT